MAPMDNNIRPTERSTAEQQAPIDPKESSKSISDGHKTRTGRNGTRNRMTARLCVRVVYVFFFLCQT